MLMSLCVCCVQCQERCRSVEQAISGLEKQSPGDSFFPVTIGRYGEGSPYSNDVYLLPLITGDLWSQSMFASHTPPPFPRPSSLPSPPPLLPTSSTPVHQDSPTSVKPLPPSSMYRYYCKHHRIHPQYNRWVVSQAGP